jgi:3-oxoacyl-[acyl-carrier protein] reductase
VTRAAIVTGGGAAAGAAARRLADRGFGVAVIAGDADVAERRIVAIDADPADTDSFAAALGRVHQEIGPPAVLLNCVDLVAGADLPDERRYARIRRALRTLFVCGRATVGPMLRGRWGRIITVAQWGGPGAAQWRDGQAVLGGLIGFTRSVAPELATFGITANYVAPSSCAPDGPRPWVDGESVESYPDGVAAVAEFLVSDRAAGITGQGTYLAG